MSGSDTDLYSNTNTNTTLNVDEKPEQAVGGQGKALPAIEDMNSELEDFRICMRR